DLSVGAVLGLSGVSAALAIRATTANGMNPMLSITIGIGAALAVGVLVGVVNGLLITRVKLAPFIATLATMGACMGTTLVVTGGVQIAGAPREVVLIGNTRFFEILTVPLIVVLIALVLAWLALS